jgi:nicotinamide phosphoribosyltransferase
MKTRIRQLTQAEKIAIGEFEVYKRLITKVYPSGIVSIVSDTYDYWRVLTDYLPRLKNEILNRDGKLVIRPDSGSPLRLICGDPEAPEGSPARKGSLELLWEAFGGTVNEKGYRVLNPKVGLIYGDSITPALCRDIISTMEVKGYASTNVVFGIGSFTYNYTTRDTYGMAVKSTYCEINGQPRNIFKDPVTDAGKMKKSLCGLVRVVRNAEGVITVKDQQKDIEDSGMLETVYTHGQLVKPVSLREIRQRLDETVVSLCK